MYIEGALMSKSRNIALIALKCISSIWYLHSICGSIPTAYVGLNTLSLFSLRWECQCTHCTYSIMWEDIYPLFSLLAMGVYVGASYTPFSLYGSVYTHSQSGSIPTPFSHSYGSEYTHYLSWEHNTQPPFLTHRLPHRQCGCKDHREESVPQLPIDMEVYL